LTEIFVKTEDLEVSLTAYARFRSRSTGWVSNQIAAGMPRSGGGVSGKRLSIPLAKAVAWEIERAQMVASEPAATERARLHREQADKLALENAVRRKELVYTATVDALCRRAASMWASELDGVPGRMAGELVGISDAAEVRHRLFKEMRSVRKRFADECGRIASDATN